MPSSNTSSAGSASTSSKTTAHSQWGKPPLPPAMRQPRLSLSPDETYDYIETAKRTCHKTIMNALAMDNLPVDRVISSAKTLRCAKVWSSPLLHALANHLCIRSARTRTFSSRTLTRPAATHKSRSRLLRLLTSLPSPHLRSSRRTRAYTSKPRSAARQSRRSCPEHPSIRCTTLASNGCSWTGAPTCTACVFSK